MVDIRTKAYERNGVETIVYNDGILGLSEKHIEEVLDHKNVQEVSQNIILIIKNIDMN